MRSVFLRIPEDYDRETFKQLERFVANEMRRHFALYKRLSTYFGTVLQHFIHQTHGERKPPMSHVTQPCATTVTRSLTSSERTSTLRNNRPLCRMGSLVGFPNATTVAKDQPCQFCPILTSASQRTLEHNARKKKRCNARQTGLLRPKSNIPHRQRTDFRQEETRLGAS